jgi:hypothetical protein
VPRQGVGAVPFVHEVQDYPPSLAREPPPEHRRALFVWHEPVLLLVVTGVLASERRMIIDRRRSVDRRRSGDRRTIDQRALSHPTKPQSKTHPHTPAAPEVAGKEKEGSPAISRRKTKRRACEGSRHTQRVRVRLSLVTVAPTCAEEVSENRRQQRQANTN